MGVSSECNERHKLVCSVLFFKNNSQVECGVYGAKVLVFSVQYVISKISMKWVFSEKSQRFFYKFSVLGREFCELLEVFLFE